MITNIDKFNIAIIIIIVIILFFCLVGQKETFFEVGRNKFNLVDKKLNYKFLANLGCQDPNNLYYIANIDYNDTSNIYFLDHNLNLEKLKINDTDFEEKIPQITFKIIFYNKTNKFDLQKVDLKPDGDTIPNGEKIDDLSNLRFIPYKFIPNSLMKIKKGIKYFMIKQNDHMNFLESDTINKNVEFKNANELNEKYKHIFFIIPYYSKSILKGNTLTQGISSIWKYFY